MSLPRPTAWRLALLASGALVLAGGPMHPGSESTDPIREELATMTADPMWVPGHSLIAVGTVLLALGLYGAARSGRWPSATRALRLGAVVVGVYVVETVMHLLAVVDSDELAAGEAAPVAFTHLGLALVLYPVTGLTLAYLAATLARAWSGPARALAFPGVVGGVLHAASVPLTFALPDAEITPVFALATVFLACWSIAVALVGIRSRAGSVTDTTRPLERV